MISTINRVTFTLHWYWLSLLAIYTARSSIATAAIFIKAALWLRVKLHALYNLADREGSTDPFYQPRYGMVNALNRLSLIPRSL